MGRWSDPTFSIRSKEAMSIWSLVMLIESQPKNAYEAGNVGNAPHPMRGSNHSPCSRNCVVVRDQGTSLKTPMTKASASPSGVFVPARAILASRFLVS